MQLLTIIICLLGLFALAFATAADSGSATALAPTINHEGYTAALNYLPYKTDVFQYKGILGGYDVDLNGTIEEMLAQMNVLHPDFEANVNATAASDADLAPRVPASFRGRFCCPVRGQPWTFAHLQAIKDSQYGLRKIPLCGVRGRSCVRVSCLSRSAIWLCNDSDIFMQTSCTKIVDIVSDLINNCRPPIILPGICGQQFDTPNYNVIVRWEYC